MFKNIFNRNKEESRSSKEATQPKVSITNMLMGYNFGGKNSPVENQKIFIQIRFSDEIYSERTARPIFDIDETTTMLFTRIVRRIKANNPDSKLPIPASCNYQVSVAKIDSSEILIKNIFQLLKNHIENE